MSVPRRWGGFSARQRNSIVALQSRTGVELDTKECCVSSLLKVEEDTRLAELIQSFSDLGAMVDNKDDDTGWRRLQRALVELEHGGVVAEDGDLGKLGDLGRGVGATEGGRVSTTATQAELASAAEEIRALEAPSILPSFSPSSLLLLPPDALVVVGHEFEIIEDRLNKLKEQLLASTSCRQVDGHCRSEEMGAACDTAVSRRRHPPPRHGTLNLPSSSAAMGAGNGYSSALDPSGTTSY
ncbi:hypothetical protein E2562_005328 [Oryza meyeriana var. granulata]|uniref:Uncharacterized protein n=1 Tax=Oryza meyeriana var. granulata TaxID=110450 RepID=A0A6G1DEU2_9ORYZ|nr:hypothetical protein E2562_005328 [Oryza meyeriana var. granulata]